MLWLNTLVRVPIAVMLLAAVSELEQVESSSSYRKQDAPLSTACNSSCHMNTTLQTLPSGTYKLSCRNCIVDYHLVLCRCARASAPLNPDPPTLNLTGEWSSSGNFSQTRDTMIVVPTNDTNKTQSLYSVSCGDGGRYDPSTCSPIPLSPIVNPWTWEFWHSGNISITINRSTIMRLDNGSVLDGFISTDNQTLTWTYRNISNSTQVPLPIVWTRRLNNVSGVKTALNLNSCRKVPWTNGRMQFNVTNENGYLTCDWLDKPPPRVGAYAYKLTSQDPVNRNCRIIPSYTFFAPQFKNRGDPIASAKIGDLPPLNQKHACCAQCHQQRQYGSTPCKGWTITDFGTDRAVCWLSSNANTAYPTNDDSTTSGYVLSADPASLCMAKFESDNGFWGDTKMTKNVSVAQIPPSNTTNQFPAWWFDGKNHRGIAWAIFPNNGTSFGNCFVNAPQETSCFGPDMNASIIEAFVRNKPWAVFVHGGAFEDYDGKDANYAETSSRVAIAANMGVLAPDVRSLAMRPTPATQEVQILDVIAALQWLRENGAFPLYIYGDSSGGTQVYETLLYIIKKRDAAAASGMPDPFNGLNIVRAATFSAWLDLSSSFPQYDTRQSCDGKCMDIASMTFQGWSGGIRLGSMCQAKKYDDFESLLPVRDPTLSPIDAPHTMLAQLPPVMLIVGGAEVLLGENLAFAQRIVSAGGSAEVQVFTDMWHDFIQETQGCGSRALVEAVQAINRVGEFFKYNQSCQVVCKGESGGFCNGAAPVKWNFNYQELPATTPMDCQGARHA